MRSLQINVHLFFSLKELTILVLLIAPTINLCQKW